MRNVKGTGKWVKIVSESVMDKTCIFPGTRQRTEMDNPDDSIVVSGA